MLKAEEKMCEVTQKVLEQLAFILPEPDIEVDASTLSMYSATIGFDGLFNGKLFLSVPENLLPAITSNMLGCDACDDIDAQQQFDALGELGNVICGNLLAKLAGERAEFNIHMPQIQPGLLPGSEELNNEIIDRIQLPVTDGIVELTLTVNDFGGYKNLEEVIDNFNSQLGRSS